MFKTLRALFKPAEVLAQHQTHAEAGRQLLKSLQATHAREMQARDAEIQALQRLLELRVQESDGLKAQITRLELQISAHIEKVDILEKMTIPAAVSAHAVALELLRATTAAAADPGKNKKHGQGA